MNKQPPSSDPAQSTVSLADEAIAVIREHYSRWLARAR